MSKPWIIPGTVLTIRREDACRADGLFQSMFLTGGLTLGQVTGISGLETHTVQNWVKRGFLPPPRRKRYSLDQVCRVLTINALRSALPMDRICQLLAYVNGRLDSETDDIIGDARLYFLFVKLAGAAREMESTDEALQTIQNTLADYREPYPGARQRVAKALQVLLIGWLAGRMRRQAELLLDEAIPQTHPDPADPSAGA